MAIYIGRYSGESYKIKNARLVKQWLKELAQGKGKKKVEELNLIFCTDDELLEINKEHLNHDYYTDIITFDMSEDSSILSGDLYISFERIQDNAETMSLPFYEEQLRVMAHGVLHLCGYGDKSKEEEIEMRHQEQLALELFKAKMFHEEQNKK